ncbi:13990_t:CDS:2 [Funneliformis caledonium]|uniref:13990_t:CDS:1 n=1 Tax=Funneliformis caledonium TaxID=1117310 RepID=A0A9N8YQ14_9GLOM|nr:13990_t:CDS:2 [Funneliformis caledonium]
MYTNSFETSSKQDISASDFQQDDAGLIYQPSTSNDSPLMPLFNSPKAYGSFDTTVPFSPNQAMEFSSFPFSNSSEISGSSTNASTFQNSFPNQEMEFSSFPFSNSSFFPEVSSTNASAFQFSSPIQAMELLNDLPTISNLFPFSNSSFISEDSRSSIDASDLSDFQFFSPNPAMEFSSNSSFISEVSGSSISSADNFQPLLLVQASGSSDTTAPNTNISYYQVHSPDNQGLITETTTTPESSQLDESCKETKLWNKGATKSFLSCLKVNKKDVQLLAKRGKTAKKVRKLLWERVSIWLKNDQYNITEAQCEVKWKNTKRDRKMKFFEKIRLSLTSKILRI